MQMAFSQNKANAQIVQRFYMVGFFSFQKILTRSTWMQIAQKEQKCCQKFKKPKVSNTLKEAPILRGSPMLKANLMDRN